MNVAVIDVGSNTIRLLVGCRTGGPLTAVAQGKRVVGLGRDVESLGAISAPKLAEAAQCVCEFVDDARAVGAAMIDVVVASPGRQARNADQLVRLISRASGAHVRVLTREEEARLAFEGALEDVQGDGVVAVCDVGGGSAQVAVGTRREGAVWIRSLDIGSMRLTSRMLDDDPPGDAAVASARHEVERMLTGFLPPVPHTALAVGGSARALRSIVGSKLGADELDEVAGILARTPAREIVELYDIEPNRVRTLAAGAVILGAIRERLHVPFQVVRGGVREGAALELAEQLKAA